MKIKIKTKIIKIYDSKLKSNAKGRYIRMKTHNLTQSHAQNDPINCRLQGFSFRDLENKFERSRCDFFRFSPSILDFKYSSDAKMSLEEVEIK